MMKFNSKMSFQKVIEHKFYKISLGIYRQVFFFIELVFFAENHVGLLGNSNVCYG